MKILYIIVYFSSILMIRNVFSQETTIKPTKPNLPNDTIDNYDENQPYCFRFTWIGPDFDNSSKVNTTCAEYLDSTRAKGVPCRQPLVYTDDGSPPNIDYMWEHHRKSTLCRQSRGQVCAKYSYSYNKELQNVTYMCTKAFVKGEGAITDGCFKQIVNEYEVELCVCNSGTGPYKPCNSAPKAFISAGLVIILTFLTITNSYLKLKFPYT